MIIWSAVVAGCSIMVLFGRHAAIYRFGTDEFTGNILFAVSLFFSSAYISVFNLYLRQSSRDCLLRVQQFMEAHELTKLHHNARAWAIDPLRLSMPSNCGVIICRKKT